MGILGLTDQTAAGSGLPRIATLYKGGEKRERTNAKGETYLIFGEDLNYFRVEFAPEFEHLRTLWESMYSDTPDSFENVLLAAPKTDDAFTCWKEEWDGAGTLIHRCNGESQSVWLDRGTGNHCSYKTPCAANGTPACKCVPTGRLNLLLTDFVDASGVLGYVAITTHSINDILTLTRYLRDIEALYGTLWGVPFTFGRAARELSAPKTEKGGKRTGERMKITKSLMFLYVRADFTQRVLLPALVSTMLPAPAPNTPLLETGDIASDGGNIVALPVTEARAVLGAGGSKRGPIGRSESTETAWTEDEMIAFNTRWRNDGITDKEQLTALGVSGLRDWKRSLASANAAVNTWMEADQAKAVGK